MPGKTFDARVIELGESIGLLVRRSRALAASEELSWTETSVLKRLGKDGPSTTADLARAQGMRPQSMRTIVAALEQMGMIERAPHSTDGRQVNLALTAKGAAVQKRVGDRKRNWLAQAISRLSERDQATLFEAGKIIRRLVEGDPQ
jgi:DNA-binding MarR family transcriptional regulator